MSKTFNFTLNGKRSRSTLDKFIGRVSDKDSIFFGTLDARGRPVEYSAYVFQFDGDGVKQAAEYYDDATAYTALEDNYSYLIIPLLKPIKSVKDYDEETSKYKEEELSNNECEAVHDHKFSGDFEEVNISNFGGGYHYLNNRPYVLPHNYTEISHKEARELNSELIARVGSTAKSDDPKTILEILENDIRLQGLGYYDKRFFARIKTDSLPWWKYDPENVDFNDTDREGIYTFLRAEYGIKERKDVNTAVNLYYANHVTNYTVDYLNQVRSLDYVSYFEKKGWQPDEIITKGIGLRRDTTPEEEALFRSMTRKWLAAATLRGFHPGYKFDHMIQLQGREGAGKTEMFKRLVPDERLYTELQSIEGKDAVIENIGTWIVALDEMKAYNKSDDDAFKTWMTKTSDKIRLPYDKYATIIKRGFVIAGSTNDDSYIKGSSGGRRNWIIPVAPKAYSITFDEISESVDYIWAAAVHWAEMVEAGEMSLELSEEEETLTNEIRNRFRNKTPIEIAVESYVNDTFPHDYLEMGPNLCELWYEYGYVPSNYAHAFEGYSGKKEVKRNSFLCGEIDQVLYHSGQIDPSLSKHQRLRKISEALRVLGFEKGRQKRIPKWGNLAMYERGDGKDVWVVEKPEEPVPEFPPIPEQTPPEQPSIFVESRDSFIDSIVNSANDSIREFDPGRTTNILMDFAPVPKPEEKEAIEKAMEEAAAWVADNNPIKDNDFNNALEELGVSEDDLPF